MWLVVLWLIFGFGVGWLADERGRSGVGYFLLSALLSPLVGLVAVLVLPNLAKQEEDAVKARELERERTLAANRQHERQMAELKALQSAVAQPGGSASVADEIQKLLALKEAGALTEEEFSTQKARLLQ